MDHDFLSTDFWHEKRNFYYPDYAAKRRAIRREYQRCKMSNRCHWVFYFLALGFSFSLLQLLIRILR